MCTKRNSKRSHYTPDFSAHDEAIPGGRRTLAAPMQFVVAATIMILPMTGDAQLPFAEDFSTSVYEDSSAGQTTADWNTTFQQLLLPSAASLSGITFDSSTAVEVIPGKFSTRSLALADLDGDGYLDLIEGTNGQSNVRLNDGSGNFGRPVYGVPDWANTRAIATGDIDRDGDIDFVEGNLAGRMRLYLNDGTGTSFAVQNVATSDQRTNGVSLADINGDGLPDIVAASIGFRPNKLYINTGDPLFPFGPDGMDGIDFGNNSRMSSRDVVTGDIDKDGDIDIVFMNEDVANPRDNDRLQRNRVFLNELAQGSSNSFTSWEIEIDGSNDVGLSMRGALGDMDGDGYLDLVVANYREGQASKIYFNNAVGSPNANPFTIPAVEFTMGPSPSDPVFAGSVSLADADKDGDLDIFLTSESVDFRNRVYFNDGNGAITGFVDVGPVGQAPLVLEDPGNTATASVFGTVGDIDGDSDIDWIIGNRGSSSTSSSLENNVFRNTGTASANIAQQLRARATSLQIDDSGANSVKLQPAPITGMVGPEFLNHIDYWVSGNSGLTWSAIMPDGRPVNIGSGTDVRWRAELKSDSPGTAAGLALFQLNIAENQSGPILGTAIGSAQVAEDDSAAGLPIFADFSDPDGDALFYSITGLAQGTGLSIDPFSGEISGTPTNEDSLASPGTVTVYVTDGAISATDTFTLTVLNANDPPVLTSIPPAGNATEDVFYSYLITASDPDPDETTLLSFSTTDKPAWLNLIDNGDGTATLSGTPANDDVSADNPVAIVVTDPGGFTDTQDFTITVENVNDSPTFTSTPVTSATQDRLFTYSITSTDVDIDDDAGLTVSAIALPNWLVLVDNGFGSAVLSGTPSEADINSDNSVSLRVTDSGGLSDDQNFVIDVVSSNGPPTFVSSPLLSAREDMSYRYAIRVTDPDLDNVTITATTLPSWLTLTDRGNGFASLVGTPSGSDVGDHSVVLVATENLPALGATASQSFIINVSSASDVPVITLVGDPQINIIEGSNYNDPGATAVDMQDGDLTDQIVASSNVETDTPGIYTITYRVADSAGNWSQADRIVRIVNRPEQNEGLGSFDGAMLLALAVFSWAYRRRRIDPLRRGRTTR